MYLGSLGMVFGSSTKDKIPSANFADIATGGILIYKNSRPFGIVYAVYVIREFGIPHHSISISLNILLTLMIVTRLVLHGRGIRAALGPSASVGGWYRDIVTVLTESCALFAVTFLLFVIPWAANNAISSVFFPILVETQVRLISCSSQSWDVVT